MVFQVGFLRVPMSLSITTAVDDVIIVVVAVAVAVAVDCTDDDNTRVF